MRVFCMRCGADLSTRAECECARPTEAIEIDGLRGRTDAEGVRYVRVARALGDVGVCRDRAVQLARGGRGRPS